MPQGAEYETRCMKHLPPGLWGQCWDAGRLQSDRRRFTHVMRSAEDSDRADLSIPGGRIPRRGVQGAREFSPQDNLGYADGEFDCSFRKRRALGSNAGWK